MFDPIGGVLRRELRWFCCQPHNSPIVIAANAEAVQFNETTNYLIGIGSIPDDVAGVEDEGALFGFGHPQHSFEGW